MLILAQITTDVDERAGKCAGESDSTWLVPPNCTPVVSKVLLDPRQYHVIRSADGWAVATSRSSNLGVNCKPYLVWLLLWICPSMWCSCKMQQRTTDHENTTFYESTSLVQKNSSLDFDVISLWFFFNTILVQRNSFTHSFRLCCMSEVNSRYCRATFFVDDFADSIRVTEAKIVYLLQLLMMGPVANGLTGCNWRW